MDGGARQEPKDEEKRSRGISGHPPDSARGQRGFPRRCERSEWTRTHTAGLGSVRGVAGPPGGNRRGGRGGRARPPRPAAGGVFGGGGGGGGGGPPPGALSPALRRGGPPRAVSLCPRRPP